MDLRLDSASISFPLTSSSTSFELEAIGVVIMDVAAVETAAIYSLDIVYGSSVMAFNILFQKPTVI